MQVMIDQIRDPEDIMRDIKTSQKEQIKDYLEKSRYDVSRELLIVGSLQQEEDEGKTMEEYVEQADYNFSLK